jgi:putative restriction endonuclease
MTNAEVLGLFAALGVWNQGSQRAPHKPLLVPYALGCWARGATSISFESVEEPLSGLLKEFGPPRKATHPEYPFWRLQTDKVWVVTTDTELAAAQKATGPSKGELLRTKARGRFSPDVQSAFRQDPALVRAIANSILQAHFPESLHQDILSSVG